MKNNHSPVGKFSVVYDWLKTLLAIATVGALVFFNDRVYSVSASLFWLAWIVATCASLALLLSTSLGKQFQVFASEAWHELSMVVWPSRSEVERITMVVIAIVGLVSLLLWLVDLGLMRLVSIFIY